MYIHIFFSFTTSSCSCTEIHEGQCGTRVILPKKYLQINIVSSVNFLLMHSCFFFFFFFFVFFFFFKVGLSTIVGKTMNLSYIISTYDFLYLLSEILEELHKTHSH
jgi:hypothetical protein